MHARACGVLVSLRALGTELACGWVAGDYPHLPDEV